MVADAVFFLVVVLVGVADGVTVGVLLLSSLLLLLLLALFSCSYYSCCGYPSELFSGCHASVLKLSKCLRCLLQLLYVSVCWFGRSDSYCCCSC